MSSGQPSNEPIQTPPTFQPVEQLPVTMLESVVLAVRRDDGTIFLAVRDLCAATHLVLSSQLRRLRSNPVLAEGLAQCQVETSGGPQLQIFLELELTPTWLLMVNTRTSAPATRDTLRHFQRYIIREVYAAFGRLTGLPETSRQIEDLDELRHVDTALTALAERQAALEKSQDLARGAWSDLSGQIRAIAARVSSLEQHVGGTISREQRGVLYQHVQLWGTATAAAHPQISMGAAMASCWAALKRRYNLARYEDLPAAKYAECIAFVRAAYRSVAGADLDILEQQPLDLE